VCDIDNFGKLHYISAQIDENGNPMVQTILDEIVSEAHQRHGWTQADLALKAGLTPETLSRAKKGCNFRTVEKVAAAAGLKLAVVPNNDYVRNVILGISLPGEN
jgi:DNA-binding phage protein